MIDRDFEQVSEEHMKSMTKPEGPAQEPQRDSCVHCGLRIYQMSDGMFAGQWAHHGSNYRHCHSTNNAEDTATPAPSQPAGAREFFIAELGRKPTGPMDNGYIRFADAYAAHKTAAKEAELAELRGIRDVVVTLLVKVTGWTRDRVEESPFNAAEAAARERDSLRELVTEIERESTEGDDPRFILAQIDALIKAENAALKAGKETKL